MEQGRTITVTQLNEYIKMLLDSQPMLQRVFVRGEISNFTDHRSGHLYFTLKDEGGLIRSVMFRGYAQKLKFEPENGMRVIIGGRVSAFPRDGQYQLYAESMEPDGIGALYIAFEQLKHKLEAEGLFDENRKQSLPHFPSRIGVITSPTGAAVHDLINITARRYPQAELVLYPSAVQGSEAPKQLVAGMEYFNTVKNVDVIIIGRGGGSLEDLWAFNNEQLARAVAASDIPVISAVGHETDFTICDFVADRRAPTPSAAAELAVPDSAELIMMLSSTKARLSSLLVRCLSQSRETLRMLTSSRVLTEPETLLSDSRLQLDHEASRLDTAVNIRLNAIRADIRESAAKLDSLNPLAVLSRGYGAVTDENGEIIPDAHRINVGQKVEIRFSDGRVKAEILSKEV